ncbi:hypothetical protein ABZ341_38810 [Streptomyces sp. NPDC006173]
MTWLAGGNGPDGPSWSPYLAIGLAALFGAIIFYRWSRRRR